LTCARCAEHEEEIRRLRSLVEALWHDLQMRYRLASGRFDREPVPPMVMLGTKLEDAA
jgi:hypothetical protein